MHPSFQNAQRPRPSRRGSRASSPRAFATTPVATGALNRASGVVGVSNVFSASEGIAQFYPGCVRLARSLYPDLPLVAYDRDLGLAAGVACGFEAVHGLTVWNR
jgi:hypothetical protein